MMHHDRTCRETSRLKEILDEAVTGQNVGVEESVTFGAEMLQDCLPHCLAHSDFPRFWFREYQSDGTNPFAAGLGEKRLGSRKDEPERDVVDSAKEDSRLGVCESQLERLLNGLGEPVGKLPHPVVLPHLSGQEPVEPNELPEVVCGRRSGRYSHRRSPLLPTNLPIPHLVTSHIASATIAPFILDSP